MALEAMRDVLYQWLEKARAPASVKGVWEDLWDDAQDHPGKPLPCPACLLNTYAVSRIAPGANDEKFATGVCVGCETVFKWLDSD
jgi:hypothetical protein